MRVFYFLILLIALAAIVVFAMQNNQEITLRYLDRSLSSSLPVLIAAVYLLGMLSGWTVIGFLKHSLRRATERREN